MLASLATAAASLPASATVPGMPGTPQPGTQVYLENFENTSAATAVPLNTYTGSAAADNEGYTGSPNWAYGTDCNGLILDSTTPEPVDNCFTPNPNGAIFWTFSQDEAIALGEFEGETAAQAASNHDLSEFTGGDPGPGTELQTTPNQIPAVAGDFYDVRADYDAVDYNGGGAGCDSNGSGDPEISLYLLNGTAATQVGSSLDPCTAPGNRDITVNGANIRVAQLVSNALKWTGGPTMGVEQYNANGGINGNDGATDNIQVINVTPQLDKSFSPATVTAGQTSQLTYTITNTSELGAKDGWSFTDSLPKGLTVASPAATTTCPSGVVTAPAGGTSVKVTGDLSAGMASCTVTVTVKAASAGHYTNGPGNVTRNGLNPPDPSTLIVTPPAAPSLTVAKSASATSVSRAGQVITYSYRVTNSGNVTLSHVKVNDTQTAPAGALTSGPTCPLATLAPGAHETCTATYTVTQADLSAGRVADSATATGTTPSGTTVTSPPSKLVIATPTVLSGTWVPVTG